MNIFKGITIPVQIVEGAISINDNVSVTGDSQGVSLAAQAKQGDAVAITGDFQVEKATGENGVIIGFVGDNPEYDFDPQKNYTKAQAISAGMLRRCGVETTFKDVREVPAKAAEGITAGKYVVWGADGYELTSSSGTTPSDSICLSGQTTDNMICIGIK